MIVYAIISLILGLLSSMFAFLGDPVTELPWGIDTPLSTFMTTINDIIYAMPWFEVIWYIFILALAIKFALFTLHWVLVIIKLVRG